MRFADHLRFMVGVIGAGVAGIVGIGAADPTAEQIIAQLKMQRIPHEGAWFAVTYGSPDAIAGEAASHVTGPHHAYSAIYALETKRDFSAMHRLAADEMWHFYSGSPLELLLLFPDGHGETVLLGPDVLHGQRPQFLVPRGVWQGSHPVGDGYALFGTTMTPGFEYSDYEPGYRDELVAKYPAFTVKIAELTRDDSLHRPSGAPGSAGTWNVPVVAPAKPLPLPLQLTEIIGRTAKEHSDRVSVAFFTLQPGAASVLSYNHEGEEIFIISHGKGSVLRDGVKIPVVSGAVINVAPSSKRSVRADEGEVLEFYAVTSPAWSPDDDVHVTP